MEIFSCLRGTNLAGCTSCWLKREGGVQFGRFNILGVESCRCKLRWMWMNVGVEVNGYGEGIGIKAEVEVKV